MELVPATVTLGVGGAKSAAFSARSRLDKEKERRHGRDVPPPLLHQCRTLLHDRGGITLTTWPMLTFAHHRVGCSRTDLRATRPPGGPWSPISSMAGRPTPCSSTWQSSSPCRDRARRLGRDCAWPPNSSGPVPVGEIDGHGDAWCGRPARPCSWTTTLAAGGRDCLHGAGLARACHGHQSVAAGGGSAASPAGGAGRRRGRLPYGGEHRMALGVRRTDEPGPARSGRARASRCSPVTA